MSYFFCRRPRGTGFLKFATIDAANAACSAVNTVAGLGILIKGRPLKVLKALDKKTANNKALEKAKKEDHDNRNLYLAKVILNFHSSILSFFHSFFFSVCYIPKLVQSIG